MTLLRPGEATVTATAATTTVTRQLWFCDGCQGGARTLLQLVAALAPLAVGSSTAGLPQRLREICREGERAGLRSEETPELPEAAPPQAAERWMIRGEDIQL